MKVLITSNYYSANTVVKSYADGISKLAEVVCSVDAFWQSNLKFDIVHMHWPEELLRWKKPTLESLDKLEKRLAYWQSNNAKVVITRHNYEPHRNHNLNHRLYEIAYGFCVGVVHLGNFSKTQFEQDAEMKSKNNVVIPHPHYLDVPNVVSKAEARKYLGLKESDFVFLSFGAIRKKEEQDFLERGFKKLKLKNKRLLITRSYYLKDKLTLRLKPIQWFRFYLKKYWLAIFGITLDNKNRIHENELQYYFNAADVVVLPRINHLNSGVLYMAFSFGKPVVGPASGNIQEYLLEHTNYLFDPSSVDSLVKVMNDSFNATLNEIGKNYIEQIKLSSSAELIASKHLEFYIKL
jgi:glycosyltransferase involved in cell wall biosynthesis